MGLWRRRVLPLLVLQWTGRFSACSQPAVLVRMLLMMIKKLSAAGWASRPPPPQQHQPQLPRPNSCRLTPPAPLQGPVPRSCVSSRVATPSSARQLSKQGMQQQQQVMMLHPWQQELSPQQLQQAAAAVAAGR
jgi:hypothetical protein